LQPERISGSAYSFDSDIWSAGLTLVECVLGRFPYPNNKPNNVAASPGSAPPSLGFWELLDFIVKEAPPVLSPEKFSKELCNFVELW
jgi:mitogen-activated protein kinase kinase 1